jgi:hypothetical protein
MRIKPHGDDLRDKDICNLIWRSMPPLYFVEYCFNGFIESRTQI